MELFHKTLVIVLNDVGFCELFFKIPLHEQVYIGRLMVFNSYFYFIYGLEFSIEHFLPEHTLCVELLNFVYII